MYRAICVPSPIIRVHLKFITGRLVTPAVSDHMVLIPSPFELARSDTLSTLTYDSTIVDAEAGVNNTHAVVVAVKYISFRHTARFADVAHHIHTVQVQADWLVTSTII